MHVTYVSEIDYQYAKAINAAASLTELRDNILLVREVADDAYQCALKMNAEDFPAFKKALWKERHGKFCGEEAAAKFSAIMVPTVMSEITMLALKFHVPWGTMYLRLKETGALIIENEIAKLVKPKPKKAKRK